MEIKEILQQVGDRVFRSRFPEWDGRGNVKCKFHDDQQPSMSVKNGSGIYKAHCFVCGRSWDSVDLLEALDGIGKSEAIKEIKGMVGVNNETKKSERTYTLDQIKKMKPGFLRSHVYKDGHPVYLKAIYQAAAGDKTALFFSSREKDRWSKGRVSMAVWYGQAGTSGTVFIVEGEKDTDNLLSIGLHGITAGSSSDIKRAAGNQTMIEALKGRDVCLVPDNDKPGRDCMSVLSKALQKVASSVRVLDVAALWRSTGLPGELPDKGDVSDYIDAAGDDARAFIEGAYSAASELVEVSPGEWSANVPPPYEISKDWSLSRLLKTKGGDEYGVQLSSFVPRISKEVMRDDGAEQSLLFEIEARDGRGFMPSIRVSSEKFFNGGWFSMWGNRAVISPGQNTKDYIRHFTQIYSGNVERKTIYTHTGWKNIDGMMVYLHGGGAVGKEGIHTELPFELLRYCLPDGTKPGASQAAMELLDVGPERVTMPVFLLCFLSVIGGLLHSRPLFSGIYFWGQTGTKKTTLSVLFTSFFGPMAADGLLNFNSTGNALTRLSFLAGDVPLIIDDMPPGHDRSGQQKLEQTAQGLLRHGGNRSGRMRLRSDLSSAPVYAPRCQFLMSGENLPVGESSLSRCLIIEIGAGEIDIEALTRSQNEAGLLPGVMLSFIKWLQGKGQAWVQSTFNEHFLKCRTQAQTELKGHPRTPEIAAYLGATRVIFAQWAVDEGFFTEDDQDETKYVAGAFRSRAWRAIIEACQRHNGIIRTESPVSRFREIMQTLIVSWRVHFRDKISGHISEGPIQSDFMGWTDEDFYYFLPDAGYQAVSKFCISEGSHFGISKASLFRMLKERNISDGSSSARCDGQVRRVLKISRRFFEVKE